MESRTSEQARSQSIKLPIKIIFKKKGLIKTLFYDLDGFYLISGHDALLPIQEFHEQKTVSSMIEIHK